MVAFDPRKRHVFGSWFYWYKDDPGAESGIKKWFWCSGVRRLVPARYRHRVRLFVENHDDKNITRPDYIFMLCRFVYIPDTPYRLAEVRNARA